MAKRIINLKIDISKMDKSKLFKGKNGAEYLNCTLLLNDEVDQYGNNGMIVQDTSKEERQAGKKGAILGNGKEFIPNGGQTATVAVSNAQVTEYDASSDLPF